MTITYHGTNYYWSWKKFLINLFIVFLIISFWTVYISKVAKATSDRKIVRVTVHHGDTLWSIAQKIAPDTDPRAVIKEIKTRNRLINTDIVAGQQLELEIASNR
ncbi:MAG: LysM peptidoglycan-binding domain-containing protein [Bacillota bacterium]